MNVREYGIKNDNPEKLATWGKQDKDKQNKNTTQYVFDTTIRIQTEIAQIPHASPYKQLEV
jgi:hypothetical protein